MILNSVSKNKSVTSTACNYYENVKVTMFLGITLLQDKRVDRSRLL